MNYPIMNIALHAVRELQMEWLRIYAGPPSVQAGSYTTHHITLWFLQQGEVTVETQKLSATIPAGSLLLLLPGRRRQRFREDAILCSMNFKLEWPNHRQVLSGPAFVWKALASLPKITKEAGRLQAWVKENQADGELEGERGLVSLPSALAWKELTDAWVACVLHSASELGLNIQPPLPEDTAFQDLLGVIWEWPLEKHFDAGEYAEKVGVSTSHLHRMFQKHLQCTARHVFEQRQSEYARQALLDPEKTVKEVASALGFHSLAQFSNWFRRIHGCSPRAYRRRPMMEGIV